MMTLVKKEPCGTVRIKPCPECGKPLEYKPVTDGLLEAMGKEPLKWICYRCQKIFRTSEVIEVTWFDEKKQESD